MPFKLKLWVMKNTLVDLLRPVESNRIESNQIESEIKIELNFYFHTSLWCLKRFYEGLKALTSVPSEVIRKSSFV